MKVLHVTPSYYPAVQFGGPIRSVHLLNQGLIRRGVALEVITTNAGLTERTDIPLCSQTKVGNVPVTYFPFIGYEHYNFSISLLSAVFRQVKNFDVVHITAVWNFPVLATALACLWHKKPFVLSPRGTLYAETIAHRSANLKKIYYKLLAGMPVKRASVLHFTTVDEAIKVTQVHALKNEYCVIPNGLDFSEMDLSSERIRPAVLPQGDYLLFLGRVDRKKGMDILIEGFSKVAPQFPNIQLVIAGPDNEQYAEVVKAMIHKAGIEQKVIFTGSLEGKDKWAAYRFATLFLLPSYSENFGMTVAEAMACKCPVIISDQVGLADEILQAEAGTVIPVQAEALADAIRALLLNPAQAEFQAQNAFELVHAKYNIESVARQFEEVYSKLIPAK